MKPSFFATPAAFRTWLEKNHEKEKELLVGFWKRDSGKPSMTWPESVDEALCFGWIDGIRKSIDETAYTIRFTPRKTTSIWSAVNVAKVAALVEAGKMRPAGARAFAARREDKTGVYSFERTDAAVLEPSEEKMLRANATASANFDARPPSYRRAALHWVLSAKRAETRASRLATLIARCEEGEPLDHLRRPEPKKKPPTEAPSVASASAGTKAKRPAAKAPR